MHAARGHHRRRPGRVDGHRRQDRRHAADPDRGDPPRLLATTSASTPACRRTASRSTSRSCSPSTPRPSPTGLTLVRREYPTAIGPVDLMCRDADGLSVAVEIKRRGEIDGVEQLTRYLELLNRDPLLAARPRHLRRPGDQAAGPRARHRPRHRLRRRRLRRPARPRRPRATGSSERSTSADLPHRHGVADWADGRGAGATRPPRRGRTLERGGLPARVARATRWPRRAGAVLRRRRRSRWCCSRSTPTCSTRLAGGPGRRRRRSRTSTARSTPPPSSAPRALLADQRDDLVGAAPAQRDAGAAVPVAVHDVADPLDADRRPRRAQTHLVPQHPGVRSAGTSRGARSRISAAVCG